MHTIVFIHNILMCVRVADVKSSGTSLLLFPMLVNLMEFRWIKNNHSMIENIRKLMCNFSFSCMKSANVLNHFRKHFSAENINNTTLEGRRQLRTKLTQGEVCYDQSASYQ